MSLPMSTRPPGSPSKAAFSGTTMGDARSEHLLLAARKVRSMRAQNTSVGRLTLDELKRHGVVGPTGGIGYSEGYGGVGDINSDEDEDELAGGGMDEDEDRKPNVHNTPMLPRSTKKSSTTTKQQQQQRATPSTPKARKASHAPAAAPLTTPGGSNFSDLLRAAEMVNRPRTPTRSRDREREAPTSVMSMTRTRMRDEDSGSERGSPTKKARTLPPLPDQGESFASQHPRNRLICTLRILTV